MEEDGSSRRTWFSTSRPASQHTILDLLGVEQEDWPQMQESVRQLLVVGAGNKEAAASAKADLTDYFAKLVEQRRSSPGKDLISAMAAARDGEDQLDDRELAVMALTLTLSGQDTATCQISDIAYLPLTRPELMERLRRRPESLTDVLQEMLRHIPFRRGMVSPGWPLRTWNWTAYESRRANSSTCRT